MKRKAAGIFLMTVTLAITGCGATATNVQAISADNVLEVSAITESVNTPIESTATEETGSIPESETVEPIYVEYEDMFMVDNYEELGNYKDCLGEVGWDNMEKMCIAGIRLNESIDLYNELGDWMGYSKPNVEVALLGVNDEWVEITFISKLSFVPREVFEKAAGIKVDEIVTEEISPKEEVPVTEIPTPVAVPPTTTVAPIEPIVPEVVSEPTVIESTKYTPEEAVAVYRSIMEANGIIWDPSIKSFASWGTGWINLEKGEPERAGNSSVASYRKGNRAGVPWTRYYLEVTGSDTNAVYITKWHCD